MGHQNIGRLHQVLKPDQPLRPGLGPARHSSRNAIDRFSRIGLHRQQKRLLRQNRAGRHIKENGADLKAGMGLGLQPRGFGVENQQ